MKVLILLIIVQSSTGESIEIEQTTYEHCSETAEEMTQFVEGYTADCTITITPEAEEK